MQHCVFQGARVVVHGDFYDQANAEAQRDADDDPDTGYIAAFNDPDVWYVPVDLYCYCNNCSNNCNNCCSDATTLISDHINTH